MTVDSWIKELQGVQGRQSENEELKFVSLVEKMHGQVNSEKIAKALLQTFSARDDNGTQECVVAALDAASSEIVVPATLQEMPRLEREAPEWARILVVAMLRDRLPELMSLISGATTPAKQALRSIIDSGDIAKRYPSASTLLKCLNV